MYNTTRRLKIRKISRKKFHRNFIHKVISRIESTLQIVVLDNNICIFAMAHTSVYNYSKQCKKDVITQFIRDITIYTRYHNFTSTLF